MKKILITGGCGFIGSNLCHSLIEKNHFVICVDNLITGFEKNIKDLQKNPNFKLIKHDIIEPLEYEGLIDEIYHLACPASPPKYQEDPIFTLKTNFIGTLNMLELARIKNAKILLTSTSEIYGEPLVSPQIESYRGNVNTTGIRSCYDEGKRVAETLMSDYQGKHGVKIAIARIFNTYGPRMDLSDGRVITNFIQQLLQKKNLTIYGNGSQTRSFCYVDDQVDGLQKLMQSNYQKPVNIGNPETFTILELADVIIKIISDLRVNEEAFKESAKLVYLDLPADDPTNRKPDITLAKDVLEWVPKVELEEGIRKTVEYFQKKID